MHLNINDSGLIEDPSGPWILQALIKLDDEEFAILSRDDDHYVQVYYNSDGTYDLEYRDGSADRHYAADPEYVGLEVVGAAFELFRAGGDLSSLLNWEQIEVEGTEPGEGEVEYNGVVMDAGWPAQIEAAQGVPTIAICGTNLTRIPFGCEQTHPTAGLQNCGRCGVLSGQLHVPGCEIEQCPSCRGQLAACGCGTCA